jgi:hypothetical protein
VPVCSQLWRLCDIVGARHNLNPEARKANGTNVELPRYYRECTLCYVCTKILALARDYPSQRRDFSLACSRQSL